MKNNKKKNITRKKMKANIKKRKAKSRAKKNIKSVKNNNKNFVIGIITVPLTPDKKYFKVCGDSYISSQHLTWMKKK